MRGKEDSGVKRHVSISVFLSVGLCLIFCMGIVGAAPSIVAWSSSGGNPTYKDNPQDLIYKVQQGDTITFTATSNQSCDWVWEVYFGARVIANFTENNTKTSSFTWQVPNETSTWSIDVACMRKPTIVGPPERAIISWTITTANLIEVNEGEDIQTAIDSLPEEGGIVELKEGTWNITSPIRIRNDNTTLVGQGMDKTIINQITEQEDAIVIKRENWTDPGFGNVKEGYLKWVKKNPDKIIQNIVVKRMTVNTKDAPGPWDGFSAINPRSVINLYVSEIKSTPNPQPKDRNDDSFGIGGYKCIDYLVKDCILDGYAYVVSTAGSYRAKTLYNFIYNSKGWAAIHYNGVWSLRPDWKPEDGYTSGDIDPKYRGNLIKGNTLIGGGASIFVYSSHGITITENHVENSYSNHAPIYLRSSGGEEPIDISYNLVKNSRPVGIMVDYAKGGGNPILHVNIFGNLLYNNKWYSTGVYAGHGISLASPPKDDYLANIYSNTIVGNDGDGIYNPYAWLVNATNNIIVNNKRYGINGKNITSTYNNIWNNTLGNYNQTSPGEGDISADPLFADPENEDFHLKSKYGRWDPNQKQWVHDSVTSPCIDAGDPNSDYSNEPDYPNGRINLGAYGNTWEASLGTPLTTGTLKGKVTDEDTGLPIEGALIEANSHQTTTNSSGEYTLNLLPGNYTVTASKEGYYSSTATAEILANQTTTLNFQLTKDTTPPAISNITVSSITSHSAVISWKTNESSTSLVKYGTSPGNYPYSKEDTSYTTSHTITLTNLQPNTTYYFVVNSTDKANNSAQSTEQSFKTKEPDTTPPIISNITVSAITGSSVTITWKTDEPATSQVEYGLTTSYGSSTPLDTNLVTEHTQTITGLKSNTTYHFRVKSKDASNNEAVSGDYTFTTTEETNLVAYYKLDEGFGTTAYDSSENGNDGTIYGATWVDGKIGKALSFDGSDDYVDLPDDIITAPSLRANGSTLIAWVKVEPSLTGRKGIVGIAACDSGWSVFGLDYYNGKVRLETYDNTLGYQRIESTTNINDGKWHHIAGTYDPSDKKMRIYVDGVLETTSSELVSPGWSTGSSLNFIGKCSMTGDYFFNGTIDEVKIYNRALSAEEILADYQGEVSHIVYVATDGTGDYNCDGEDDQIEINQAIAYINSIGGGIVHLKNGTFVISDSINLSSNLIFEGEGTEKTTIKIEDGSTKENWATIVGDGISSTTIRNLTIDGNKHNCPVPKGINSDIDAFHLYNSNNITVENVKMIDFWTDGVEFSHSSDSVVKNCEVIQAGHEGLRAIYSDNITFSNNYVYSAGTGNAGIRIYESSNCIVERNYFNVYGFGILINPQGGVTCGNNIYRDNYIEGHYGLPGIALWPWDTEVSNETFIRNIIAKTDGTQEPYGHGINLRTRGTASLKDIEIINNVINNAIKSGIYVEDGADVSNIVAKNNIIVNNGEYGIYGNCLLYTSPSPRDS